MIKPAISPSESPTGFFGFYQSQRPCTPFVGYLVYVEASDPHDALRRLQEHIYSQDLPVGHRWNDLEFKYAGELPTFDSLPEEIEKPSSYDQHSYSINCVLLDGTVERWGAE